MTGLPLAGGATLPQVVTAVNNLYAVAGGCDHRAMSELPPGAITSADLYRKMEDLRVNVTVAMEKLAAHASEVSDHEARIRGLERFASKLMGGAVTAGILSGAVTGVLAAVLTHH